MSFGSTLSDQPSLSASMTSKISKGQEANFFQRIDILGQELEGLTKQMMDLQQECQSIRSEKDNVDKYLERSSEENRQRLMGEMQLFEFEIQKKIDQAKAETQKVDERINEIKQGQLYTLQMILALQRRVQELEVQLGLQNE